MTITRTDRKPDLAQIKRSLTFSQLIARYNLRLKPQTNNSFRGQCPLSTHTNEKDNNSFTATLKDKGWVWDCFSTSCIANRSGKKGGNIIDFVMLMEGDSSLFQIGCKLNEWFALNAWLEGASPSNPDRNAAARHTKQAPPNTPPHTKPVDSSADQGTNEPLGFRLQHIDYAHPYLSGRGITQETASYFGVGHFPGNSKLLKGKIVFPIWGVNGDENPVAYAGRSIDDSEPKYVFPPGFKKSLELWNCNRMGDSADWIMVLEGFFSVMRFHQAGICNAVSLMGTSASPEQLRLLSRFSRVSLCLDPDEAGCSGAQSILSALSPLTHVRVITPDAQPDELDEDAIRRLVGA